MKKSRMKAKQGGAASGLLASAAAMLVPSVAKATTFNETTDFPEDLDAPFFLPANVDQVNGTLQNISGGGGDHDDVFVFTGWTPGTQFTLQIIHTQNSGAFNQETLNWFDEDTNATLDSRTVAPNQSASFNGIVPANGNIAVDVHLGINAEGTNDAYTINLTAQAVPEPGAIALMGAAVATAAIAKRLRRRKKK